MAKKKAPIDFPGWMTEVLRCHECGDPCVLTARDKGMVCFKHPSHTGMIRRCDWEEKVILAHKLALGRGACDNKTLPVEKALVWARKYLELPLTKKVSS